MLELWQDRLKKADNAFSAEWTRMDRREDIYNGDDTLDPLTDNDYLTNGKRKRTPHKRNIVFENIESQVSTSIPLPKVTARHKCDEKLAEKIEHFLRNEIDRLPFERINDMAERTVPIQGGCFYLLEWDNEQKTHDTCGELNVTLIHPKQIAPQPGIYEIEQMDWVIVKIPETKTSVKNKYGKDVSMETEKEPYLRGENAPTEEENVTVYIGFEKTENGIDKFVWCNDVVLEDIKNYQSRRQPTCSKCGRTKPYFGMQVPTTDPFGNIENRNIEQKYAFDEITRNHALGMDVPYGEGTEPYKGGACPWCGCEDWTSAEQKYEKVFLPIEYDGGVIPGATPSFEDGVALMQPTMVPYYTPNCYPIILQKSVSCYGKLLGNSDVDVIENQQNTTNRIEKKIIDRLVKAGTRITLPPKARINIDPEDGEKIYLTDPSDKAMIGSFDFAGNLQFELAYLSQVYEEARQTLGITNSFQGREDTTAKSGVAKRISAAQSAGRLESKRVMKEATYADIYKMMFQFWLAYADEPREVMFKDSCGNSCYEEISRYDFVKEDENGYYWNDEFLFSVDTTSSLSQNRAEMWDLNNQLLMSGAFGNPQDLSVLIMYWSKQEMLHYPGASETKAFLEEQLQKQQELAMQQQMEANQRAMISQKVGEAYAQPESGNMGREGVTV